MSHLLKQAVTAAENGEAVEGAEAARIGAAADRKRRRENEQSLNAVLSSEDQNGAAVYWTRTNRANGESRPVLMVERSGAYGERQFLRLAEKAAGQAAKGQWQTPERVEALTAELVVRILAKTQGRMPKRGSLGRHAEGHENPDLAYLTTAAKRLIASVAEGEPRAAGLAGEVGIYAADISEGGEAANLADMAATAIDTAEGDTDPYLAGMSGDYLTDTARGAAARLSAVSGRREAAQQAAISAALRPHLRAADLADAGYAATGGALRKAAHTGRAIVGETLTGLYDTSVSKWTAAHWATADALACLCEEETATPTGKPINETGPMPYRRPVTVWPMDCNPIPRAERGC